MKSTFLDHVQFLSSQPEAVCWGTPAQSSSPQICVTSCTTHHEPHRVSPQDRQRLQTTKSNPRSVCSSPAVFVLKAAFCSGSANEMQRRLTHRFLCCIAPRARRHYGSVRTLQSRMMAHETCASATQTATN